ncbi:hypothetical protein [Photobacterium halotolerans]|nr:hypothetical protein [Photobacterium halotolerans]
MSLNDFFNKTKLCLSCQLVSTALMTMPLMSPVYAQPVSFEGERVQVTVPYKEGGGTDTWGRFFGP